MTTGRDNLTKSETVTIAAIEGGVAPLIEARAVINAFHAMIRKRAGEELAPWIEGAQSSLVTSFANGVAKDKSAIGAFGRAFAFDAMHIYVRIPTKPAMHSNMKPATNSDPKPAGVPI
jgi:hypothetical protein